ncbi:hypothetical protein D082_02450 [Synechocystis sp. PCC 6714]|nr:hypothetical protein D082_02450 [Synechocystis sp. PCC 6714]
MPKKTNFFASLPCGWDQSDGALRPKTCRVEYCHIAKEFDFSWL